MGGGDVRQAFTALECLCAGCFAVTLVKPDAITTAQCTVLKLAALEAWRARRWPAFAALDVPRAAVQLDL